MRNYVISRSGPIAAIGFKFGHFLRTLAMPGLIKDWSMNSLKKKLIRIIARVHQPWPIHCPQMAKVAIPR